MALIAENPYLPIAGINPDAQSLSTGPNEAVDSLNFRVLPDKLRSRGGSTRLAGNVPSGDPILHLHTFLTPDNEELLFGFTKTGIWKFLETTGLWQHVLESEVFIPASSLFFDSMNVITGWSGNNPTLATYTPDQATVKSVFFENTGNVYDFSKSGYGVDLSTKTHIQFTYLNVYTGGLGGPEYTMTVNFKDSGASLIESFAVVINSTSHESIGLWKRATLTMTTPANWTDVDEIEFYISPVLITESINIFIESIVSYRDAFGAASPPFEVTFWSTTDFIDDTIGSTVIACGSTPPQPGNAESDGSERVIYYYDEDAGDFKPLTINQRIQKVDEDLSKTVPASGTGTSITTGTFLIPGPVASAAAATIIGGTITFYTKEYGAIASASAILAGGKFALIPASPSSVVAGSDSFVLKVHSGTIEYSIKFDLAAQESARGLAIYATYTYLYTLPFNPRFVRSFHNRLVFANTYEDTDNDDDADTHFPWRVRWGRAGDMDEADALDYQDLVNVDVSPISGLEYQGFYINVVKFDSIVRMYHVEGEIPRGFQDTQAAFNFQTIWQDGMYGIRSMATFNQIQYFLGKDDIYAFDGNAAVSITKNPETGATRVREQIFQLLNEQQINNCILVINEEHDELWCFIVKASQTYPTDCFVYNIFRRVWYKFRFSAVTAVGAYHTVPRVAIEDLIGNIDDQTWIFDSAILEGLLATPVLCFSTGDAYLVDETVNKDECYFNEQTGAWVPGTNIQSELITRDFIFQDLSRQDRIQKVKFAARGTDVEVAISPELAFTPAEFKQNQTITLNKRPAHYNYFPDMEGYHHRFYFKFTTWAELRWLQPLATRKKHHNE